MVLVSLPSVNIDDYNFNKLYYKPSLGVCQQDPVENTMEYNYITTEKYLESQLNKHQDIIR